MADRLSICTLSSNGEPYPVPSEGAIYEPIKLSATVLRLALNEIEDLQERFQLATSGDQREEISSCLITFLCFLAVELNPIPHLLLIYTLESYGASRM
jgi:hypothetical protein